MNLTKDAKVILYEMYNYYLMQRQCGKSKRESVSFGSAENIRNLLFPEMLLEDVTAIPIPNPIA